MICESECALHGTIFQSTRELFYLYGLKEYGARGSVCAKIAESMSTGNSRAFSDAADKPCFLDTGEKEARWLKSWTFPLDGQVFI